MRLSEISIFFDIVKVLLTAAKELPANRMEAVSRITVINFEFRHFDIKIPPVTELFLLYAHLRNVRLINKIIFSPKIEKRRIKSFMTDIKIWMKDLTEKLQGAFGEKLEFVGLQGSYGRGEATESSDIDVVVIFRELVMGDLERYKDLIGEMPYREKICGFVSGRGELINWDKADLFQFYHDTTPYFGSIDYLLPLVNRPDAKRAVLVGACNIYHMCVHNFLHEYDAQILRSLCKTSFFVMIAKHFYETGDFIKKKSDLIFLLSEEEQELLGSISIFDRTSPDKDLFRELSEKLLMWSGGLINAFGD